MSHRATASLVVHPSRPIYRSPTPRRTRAPHRLFRAVSGIAVLILASGCARGARGLDGSVPPQASHQLTAADFESVTGVRNLLEGIERLRPHFLRLRRSADGGPPTVYVNGVPAPTIEALRELRIEQVRLVRLLNGPEATMRYGSMYGNGILEVTIGDESDRWR